VAARHNQSGPSSSQVLNESVPRTASPLLILQSSEARITSVNA
jgi:hypothetical protein